MLTDWPFDLLAISATDWITIIFTSAGQRALRWICGIYNFDHLACLHFCAVHLFPEHLECCRNSVPNPSIEDTVAKDYHFDSFFLVVVLVGLFDVE